VTHRFLCFVFWVVLTIAVKRRRYFPSSYPALYRCYCSYRPLQRLSRDIKIITAVGMDSARHKIEQTICRQYMAVYGNIWHYINVNRCIGISYLTFQSYKRSRQRFLRMPLNMPRMHLLHRRNNQTLDLYIRLACELSRITRPVIALLIFPGQSLQTVCCTD